MADNVDRKISRKILPGFIMFSVPFVLLLVSCGEEAANTTSGKSTGGTRAGGGSTQASANTWTYELPGEQV